MFKPLLPLPELQNYWGWGAAKLLEKYSSPESAPLSTLFNFGPHF